MLLIFVFEIQELKSTNNDWYKTRIGENILYHLSGGNKENLGRVTFVINDMPPDVFEHLFTRYIGKIYGGKTVILETKKNGDNTKITSRTRRGQVPYEFMSTKFNKGLSFETKCNDVIKRDVKEFNVTYTLPLGNLTIDCMTWIQMPNSDIWQSLE